MIMGEKELLRVEELKHHEELLGNCIEYLWEIWNNEDADTIEKSFRRLGFTDNDLLWWDISYELEIIERESDLNE